VKLSSLPVRLGCSPSDTKTLIAELGEMRSSSAIWHVLRGAARHEVDPRHRRRVSRRPASSRAYRSAASVASSRPARGAAIDALVAGGRDRGGPPAPSRLARGLMRQSPNASSSIWIGLARSRRARRIESEIGQPLAPVLHFLERRGDIVKSSNYGTIGETPLVSSGSVRGHGAPNDVTLATLRDRVGLSRKFRFDSRVLRPRWAHGSGPSGRVWRDV
jgi:hypothetical protein